MFMVNFFQTTEETILKNENLLYEKIIGSRRFSNFFWAIIILLGGLGFFIVGLSSFFKFNILNFLDASEIIFFPQGLVMCFYGFLGIILSIYQWSLIAWKIGEGYNEFNRQTKTLKLFRWGFPGKNRKIEVIYPFEEVNAIRVEINEGINPNRTIYSAL